MGFGSSPSAQIINIVARTFYSVWEIRNPVDFSSLLLTKKVIKWISFILWVNSPSAGCSGSEQAKRLSVHLTSGKMDLGFFKMKSTSIVQVQSCFELFHWSCRLCVVGFGLMFGGLGCVCLVCFFSLLCVFVFCLFGGILEVFWFCFFFVYVNFKSENQLEDYSCL